MLYVTTYQGVITVRVNQDSETFTGMEPTVQVITNELNNYVEVLCDSLYQYSSSACHVVKGFKKIQKELGQKGGDRIVAQFWPSIRIIFPCGSVQIHDSAVFDVQFVQFRLACLDSTKINLSSCTNIGLQTFYDTFYIHSDSNDVYCYCTSIL